MGKPWKNIAEKYLDLKAAVFLCCQAVRHLLVKLNFKHNISCIFATRHTNIYAISFFFVDNPEFRNQIESNYRRMFINLVPYIICSIASKNVLIYIILNVW